MRGIIDSIIDYVAQFAARSVYNRRKNCRIANSQTIFFIFIHHTVVETNNGNIIIIIIKQ